jgi:hypothetical protein
LAPLRRVDCADFDFSSPQNHRRFLRLGEKIKCCAMYFDNDRRRLDQIRIRLRDTAVPAHRARLGGHNEFRYSPARFEDDTIDFHSRRRTHSYVRLVNE